MELEMEYTKTTHTKGPWGIGSTVEGRGAYLFSGSELRTVAWVEPWPYVRSGSSALPPMHEHADIRLMASSPSLYSALREMAFYFQNDLKSPNAAEMADRVLRALTLADGGEYMAAMGGER